MSVISTEFGRIVDASLIEQAVEGVLQMWFPTFLRELEQQRGLVQGSLTPPLDYTQRNVFDSLTGEELPKCVIISPGLANPPQRYQAGMYRATWRLGVGIAVADKDPDTASMNAKILSSSARAILLKFPNLKSTAFPAGLGSKITWVDQNSDDIPIASKIWNFRASAEFFTVDIENVINTAVRPNIPDLAPDQYDYGKAQTVKVGVVVKGIND